MYDAHGQAQADAIDVLALEAPLMEAKCVRCLVVVSCVPVLIVFAPLVEGVDRCATVLCSGTVTHWLACTSITLALASASARVRRCASEANIFMCIYTCRYL